MVGLKVYPSHKARDFFILSGNWNEENRILYYKSIFFNKVNDLILKEIKKEIGCIITMLKIKNRYLLGYSHIK